MTHANIDDDMDRAWRTCNALDRSIKNQFSATHGQDLSLMNDDDIEQYFVSALNDKNDIIEEIGIQKKEKEQFMQDQLERDLQIRLSQPPVPMMQKKINNHNDALNKFVNLSSPSQKQIMDMESGQQNSQADPSPAMYSGEDIDSDDEEDAEAEQSQTDLQLRRINQSNQSKYNQI